MDVRQSFEWALTTLIVSLVAMFVVMVAVKLAREVRTRRRERMVRDMRPLVIEAIETGGELPLERGRRSVAESIATSLLPKLRGEDRVALAELLGGIGVIDRARRGLRSHSASRRVRSAQLLGAAGTVDAVGDILALLDDRDRDVRQAATQALGRIGDPSAAVALFTALDQDRISGHAASMAVMRIGQSASDDIVAALSSRSPRSRVVAAELVGILGVYSARARLEELVDDVGAVAEAAIRSLGRLGFPSSAAMLSTRLAGGLDASTSDEITINVAIVRALQSIGDPASVSVLRHAVAGPYRVAIAARRALDVLEPGVDIDIDDAVVSAFDEPYSPLPELLLAPASADMVSAAGLDLRAVAERQTPAGGG